MKNSLLLIIFVFTFVNVSAQSPCGNLETQPGTWVKTPPVGKDLLMVKNINTAMSLFQKSVAGFTGGHAQTYTFTAEWVDTRPYKYQGYTVAMLFSNFECINRKLKSSGATETWLYISFNEFPFFKGNSSVGQGINSSEFFRLSNGQQMFVSTYRLDGKYKGMNRLVPLHHTSAEAVFLSKSNELPLRSVSQADVLLSYKKFFTQKKDAEITRLETVLAKEPADLARIANDKYITDKEQSKKTFIDGNNRLRGNLAQFKKERTECVSTIDSHLARPASKQPALIEGIDEYCNPEKMFKNPNSPNAKQIVVFDENFFNPTLPPSSPQFIVVYWRKGDAVDLNRDGSFRYPSKREFIRKFEENLDFDGLKQMLGK